MDLRNRRNSSDSYTPEQVGRVITGSGLTIQNELDENYIIFCPFHLNSRTPAAEIHKYNGTLFCFSCHKVADLIELVMHTTGRTYFESVRFIKSKEQVTNIQDDVARVLEEKPEYPNFDESLIIQLSNAALQSDKAISYFASRKITIDSIKKFSLGFSEKRDMVTVPVHSPSGIPVGFVGRSIAGKQFKNTDGLPKAKVLFNLHRVKSADKVYVVESSFDAIRLDQCGLPAVATLGANVSSFQIDLLQKYFNNIIVIADNDEAGGNMKERLQSKLGHRISVIQLNSEYKDIGDMSDGDISKLEVSFDKSIASMLN